VLAAVCGELTLYVLWLHYAVKVFRERETDLHRLSQPLACRCFATSIWDETLYKVMTALHRQLTEN